MGGWGKGVDKGGFKTLSVNYYNSNEIILLNTEIATTNHPPKKDIKSEKLYVSNTHTHIG